MKDPLPPIAATQTGEPPADSPLFSPVSSVSAPASAHDPFTKTRYKALSAISLSHFLNDATQSILVPLYPMFKGNFDLNFAQIGLITLTYQLIASFMQPVVGLFTDRRPQPYSLPFGMVITLSGVCMLAIAASYHQVLIGAALMGAGSSIFHPECARLARMAAGTRLGLAQSVFQLGGATGSSCGPLLATVLVPLGQWSIGFMSVLPLAAIALLLRLSRWAGSLMPPGKGTASAPLPLPLPRPVVMRTLGILLLVVFAKDFYIAGITNYLIFYLEATFNLSEQVGQMYLFLFLAAAAAGTLVGGPIGDRIGRKRVIAVSMLGAAPFSLLLPYADLFWSVGLVMVVGFILASAFPTIVVFAQELMPGRLGAVAGLFYGLSFGAGGVGAAVLGKVADVHGIGFVYHICSFLPLIGVLALILPNPRDLDAKGQPHKPLNITKG